MQKLTGIFFYLTVCLAGSAAHSGGSSFSIDGKTGLETRGQSIDDPTATPIPFHGNLERQELEVRWSPIKTDALGNELILSGKLLHVEETDTARPLCNQPFSIYLARQSDKRLDWSKKAIYSETMMVDGFSDKEGNFVGSADLSKTSLALDNHGTVQVAIASASAGRRGRERWVFRRNDRPGISSSVKMLKLPPAPKLAPATDELNRLRSWPDDDLDGTQLLRTAMSLQKAGKDSALDAIDAFINVRIGDRQWRTGDFDDERVVGMITHLVFESKDGSPPPPSYICFFDFAGGDDGEALKKQWPNGSVMFSSGIPFVAGRQRGGFAGVMPPIDRFSNWIKEHGRLRNQPFEPTVDPLNAAERLLNSPIIKAITDKTEEPFSGSVQINYIRRQALAMVGLPINPEQPHYAGPEIPEDLWRRLIEVAKSTPIAWDSKLQRFDARRSSPRYQELIDEAMKSKMEPCDK
ncbi:hypothetical protein [Stieleria marina]|uniref:Secreted protein n=1 Tax=Stieleria marina TaxID=1930275 RepID=A0A517NQ12_9BACT|nr:hypothetical protein K239x_11550 [Planctomycetes bacterium K23_9]